MRARHLAALVFVGVACSFVRDPEWFSVGGELSEPDASTGCKQNGQACGTPAECCTGRCEGGVCRCDDLGEECIEGSCCNAECVDEGTRTGKKICGLVGACSNDADKAALAAIEIHTEMENCDSSCAALPGDQQPACYKDCAVTVGLSSDCASCYAHWWGLCVKAFCDTECSSGTQSCKDCCDTNVSCAYFLECSGFSSCP